MKKTIFFLAAFVFSIGIINAKEDKDRWVIEGEITIEELNVRGHFDVLDLKEKIAELLPIQNVPPHGFGRAVRRGLKVIKGDAVVIMMARLSVPVSLRSEPERRARAQGSRPRPRRGPRPRPRPPHDDRPCTPSTYRG